MHGTAIQLSLGVLCTRGPLYSTTANTNKVAPIEELYSGPAE
jgi:hypothetical protein